MALLSLQNIHAVLAKRRYLKGQYDNLNYSMLAEQNLEQSFYLHVNRGKQEYTPKTK